VKHLLIGGGLASFHAAKQIRKAGDEGSVLLVGEQPLPPYDLPPLSKEFLRGEKTVDDIIYETAEQLAGQKIDLLLGVRIDALDATAKTATLSNGETVAFEKALIATGGRPITLSFPGVDLAGVHYLRTAADAQAIREGAHNARRALVIGAGFIGLEVAASLTQLGLDVTVVEAAPRVWARFADEQLAGFIQDYCSARGVTFRTGELVTELRGDGRVDAAVTRSGQTIECDLVCIGVGILPNVELAEAAGLAVDNGIVVDAQMRTSHPDIYAAGDVVNYPDPASGKRRRVEHWGHAEYGGQIAGRNMAGGENAYDLLSYVWSDIFDLRLEFAGDETDHDRAILRGSPADASFMIVYMKGDLATAYFAVNTDVREFSMIRRAIRAKTNLAGREADLQNKQFNLRELF
jgi:NADPH-dependent 2,4-dienoyl-CoA reductase/sulfur reductase-like enzyme